VPPNGCISQQAAEKPLIRLEAGIARRFKIGVPGPRCHLALGRRATPAFKREYSRFFSSLLKLVTLNPGEP
jgi:hypothetical protein